MGAHYYESSTYTSKQQQTRLNPAIFLSQHSIPSIVWAEDGLAFAHTVPTVLFSLQLIVADNDVEDASKVILENLPYVANPEPLESSCELWSVDREMPPCFPRSKRLSLVELPQDGLSARYTPYDIILHPASFFQFDVEDRSRSLPLDDIPDDVRCPTRAAFFDSLISTMMDPPLGYFHWTLFGMMTNFAAYLASHAIRKQRYVTKSGKLKPECQAVVDSLRPENREWMDGFLSDVPGPTWYSIRHRRDFLIARGREKEVKPFPQIKCPGNPLWLYPESYGDGAPLPSEMRKGGIVSSVSQREGPSSGSITPQKSINSSSVVPTRFQDM